MELSTRKNDYQDARSSIKRPLIVGFYSVDEKGDNHISTENLSYLKWDRFSSGHVRFDLTKGEDTAVRRSDKNEMSFYSYLSGRPQTVHKYSSSKFSDVGFILYRQVLRKIANIPYQDRDDELFGAYLFEGNIYLDYIKKEEVSNPRWERCSRWGYKFEQYVLSADPNLEPDTSVPVKEGEEFGCVFQSKMGQHRLFYVAEMDGIIIDRNDKANVVPDVDKYTEEYVVEELRKRNFLELKSSIHADHSRLFRTNKSREIYLQSYFSGVNDVVIGYRNYDGIVNSIQRYRLSDMMRIGDGYWNSDICLNFLSEFLTFVKKCFNDEMAKIPEYKPDMDIRQLPPIELIFERRVGENVAVHKNAGNSIRKYLNPNYINKVTINTKKATD